MYVNTVGYLSGHEDDHEDEKRSLAEWRGHAIETWYADGAGGDYVHFRRLTEDVESGIVGAVVHRSIEFLPEDPELLDAFYEAARENDVVVLAVEESRPSAFEVLAAKLVPLLHEWNTRESEDMATRGHLTVYAGAEDVFKLREFLGQYDDPIARRWVAILPPVAKIDSEED